MRIYLDNCCYNRPYDGQTQLRISLESQAKLHIQDMIRNGKVDTACAMIARCDYLLTTDDRLLRYRTDQIMIVDPTEFIRLYGGEYDE